MSGLRTKLSTPGGRVKTNPLDYIHGTAYLGTLSGLWPGQTILPRVDE